MKKLAIVVTSVLLLLALVGCGTFSYDIRDYVEIPTDYATSLVISKSDVDKQVNESRSNLLENYKGEEEITTGVVGDGMTTYIYYKGVATLFDGLFSFEMGKNTFKGLDEALKDVEFKDGKATVSLTLASDFTFPEEIGKAMKDKADAKALEDTTTEPATETPTAEASATPAAETEEPATESPTAEEYNPAVIAPVVYDDETPAVATETPAAGETPDPESETPTETAEPEDPYETYNTYYAGQTVTVELTIEGKEGTIAEGETVAAKLKITHAFSGGTYDETSSSETSKSETARKGYELKIGSGSFIPGFETGMIGMSVEKGTVRDVAVTFPSPYSSNTVLSGMDAVFTVTIQSVWHIYTRDLSNAEQFAALKAEFEEENGTGSFDYKDEADYIAGLTLNVKSSLAADKLVEKSKANKFKYADLEDYENSLYNYYARYYYSLVGTYPDFNTVLSTFFGGDSDSFVTSAGKQLKHDLVLYQVARDQGLEEVTDEEYRKFIDEQLAAANAGRTDDNLVAEDVLVDYYGGKAEIEKSIVLDKAQKWLGEHVTLGG